MAKDIEKNTPEEEGFGNDILTLVDEDGTELVILKVVEDNGEEFLEPIEDDDEFEEISEIFMDRLEEYYDFDAGEEE